jgi:hypothetical protein
LKRNLRIAFSSILILVITLISGSVAATAATNSNSISTGGNGYRISPVRTDLVIQRGQTKTTTVFLTNLSPSTVTLKIIVDDFQSKDESGTPALLLNGQSLPRHGLKQYVSVPKDNITVKPGEQKTIIASISMPSTAAPGGYYGAVRFSPVDASGNKNVNLAASVGSLILVKVPGNVKEDVAVTTFGVGRGDRPYSIFFNNKKLQAIIKFKNNGDVQEEPFGKIQLKKGNNVLATYEVNNTDPRGNVLPDSIRRFTVPLDKVGKIGKFTIEGNFGYGSSGQLISASSTFYVIPLSLIVLVILVILLIIAGFITIPRAVRRHDRRILRMNRRR